MKIIIAGAGRIGSALAEVLAEEGHDVAVIDRDSDTVDHISGDIDAICIAGSAADPDVLRDAGAETADLLIAATEKDEVNMVCGISARKLGTANVIARVRDPEYLGKSAFLKDTFGISMLVNPEYECAEEISRVLRFPGSSRVDAFSKGSAEIVEYRVIRGDLFDGAALRDIGRKFGAKVLVSLVERSGEAYIPKGSFVFGADDRLSIMGTTGELRKFFLSAGAYKKPVKSVMIMGGGRMSVYLTKILRESGISATVIEADREKCEKLCELIPYAGVVCGDATRSDVLLEENIKSKDAFVALTGDDGNNIITSIYARSCGVPKTVVKVDHEHFAGMVENMGPDSIVTPKEVVVQQISRYVRALSNSAGSNTIETLYKLADGRAEAIEFSVGDSFRFAGIPLRDLKLRDDVLVAAIIRDNKSIIPDGSSDIRPGDNAIVVTTSGWLKDINDIV